MTRRTTISLAGLMTALALIAALSAGCSAPSGSSSSSGSSASTATAGGTDTTVAAGPGTQSFGTGAQTAQGYYDIALKAVKASYPDAVLFIVQTPGVVNTEPVDSWTYLFGSKKAAHVYAVTVAGGKAGKVQAAGAAGLNAKQWAAVPGIDAWKVDSTTAFAKASAAYQQRFSTATPLSYAMGMATYAPGSTAVKAFVWSVNFDPNGDAASAKARQIDVNATTGEVLAPAK